jgi:hypothetical protein
VLARQNQISLNSSFENLLAASFLNPETQEMRRFAEVTVRRRFKSLIINKLITMVLSIIFFTILIEHLKKIFLFTF